MGSKRDSSRENPAICRVAVPLLPSEPLGRRLSNGLSNAAEPERRAQAEFLQSRGRFRVRSRNFAVTAEPRMSCFVRYLEYAPQFSAEMIRGATARNAEKAGFQAVAGVLRC